MTSIDVPVLVVGGGPTGLQTGVHLSKLGISSHIVERRPGPQRSPAAHVVNARTLEIYRALGIDAATLDAVSKSPADAGSVHFVARLGGESLTQLPFERQGDECLAYTPTPLRNLSQHKLEPILAEAARKSAHCELAYEHQWESAIQGDRGVISRIRDLARDREYEIHSRYVIGADGAGSRVRKALDIGVQGPERLMSFVMIHFGANLRSLVSDCPGVLYWLLDPAVGGTLVAHDIDREWVYMKPWDPDTESLDAYTESVCADLVRNAMAPHAPDLEILNISAWTMTSQVADRYRVGRVFLAGDAAHRFPPTGGLGLNTGAQDAHNLVWKIAAVEDGWADATLLDSYETERRPVAQENATQSLRNALKLLQVQQALGTDAEPTTQRLNQILADSAGRARAVAAMRDQAEHFDMLGLQLGFAYEVGALVPDATELPRPQNPVREYIPSARPGSRLPHAWLTQNGARISSLDLISGDGFVLLTVGGDPDWANAVQAVESIPLRHIALGLDVTDPTAKFCAQCVLAPGGALLVRPDQHVAWRAQNKPEDPRAALLEALTTVTRTDSRATG